MTFSLIVVLWDVAPPDLWKIHYRTVFAVQIFARRASVFGKVRPRSLFTQHIALIAQRAGLHRQTAATDAAIEPIAQ
jgi:hypothetical protein